MMPMNIGRIITKRNKYLTYIKATNFVAFFGKIIGQKINFINGMFLYNKKKQ